MELELYEKLPEHAAFNPRQYAKMMYSDPCVAKLEVSVNGQFYKDFPNEPQYLLAPKEIMRLRACLKKSDVKAFNEEISAIFVANRHYLAVKP